MENAQKAPLGVSKGILQNTSKNEEGDVFIPSGSFGRVITQEMVEGESRSWLAEKIERIVKRMTGENN